ncbi:MAG: hypothetical protein ABII25_00380 [bacterium]
MAKVIINGRQMQIPNSATADDIKKTGKIGGGRTLIHRKKTGNYAVKHGERIDAQDGDNFVDAPPRVKGF